MYIKEIHRIVITLVLFVAFNSFVVNPLIIVGDRHEITLPFVFGFFERGTPYSDSWWPLGRALEQVHDSHSSDSTVYQRLFFDRHIKFSYPPTCLALFEPVRLLPNYGRLLNPLLNSFSWLLLLGTSILTAKIFILGLRRSSFYLGISSRRTDEELLLAGLMVVASLTFFPLVRAFVLGQIQTWMTFLFAASILAWMTDRKKTAGVLIAVVCAIKPQLWPLSLWGIVRREWNFVGSLTATLALFLTVSISLYGWETHVDYLRVLVHIAQRGESYFPNQSMGC